MTLHHHGSIIADNTDFIGVNTTLSFDFTTSQTCVRVDILEDIVFERNETFQLQLSSDDQVVILPDHEVIVTITDNDCKSCDNHNSFTFSY